MQAALLAAGDHVGELASSTQPVSQSAKHRVNHYVLIVAPTTGFIHANLSEVIGKCSGGHTSRISICTSLLHDSNEWVCMMQEETPPQMKGGCVYGVPLVRHADLGDHYSQLLLRRFGVLCPQDV
jgi:hypothetical protein